MFDLANNRYMVDCISVLVHTPAHAGIGPVLSYLAPQPLGLGALVRVPLGNRETLGVVWDVGEVGGNAPHAGEAPGAAVASAQASAPQGYALRPIAGTLQGVQPLGRHWCQLVRFAARYYQRSAGEVALAALPPQLRELSALQVSRRLAAAGKPARHAPDPPLADAPSLTAEQGAALERISAGSGPFLLFGTTGSGKTEVYLQAAMQALAQDPGAQVLVMVPEINLTPQLESRFRARFEPLYGAASVVCMHSGMTNPQRLRSWLAAHQGPARIVLGTRMAVFASMPRLRLIVVDEEHDPSYKSGEGARYSARDLAVYRGRLDGAKVLLGSATPSLESWYHSRDADQGGRYERLLMPSRVGQGALALPLVRRVDMAHQPKGAVVSPPLLDAIRQCIGRGEQCLVFINRRGYAPVLHCDACGWKSACSHCSAFRVFHKIDRTLRCHHCGFTDQVPKACPGCGNLDIASQGRGTELIEEHIAELLAELRRPGSVRAECPDGEPVRVARIDADSTRLQGSLQTQMAAVHDGEVDVLVGTQMIAKGHDFRRVTLVAAINPDGALYSVDYRAPERLFSLLMQAAGRAGRDAALGAHSEVWIQTHQPAHPLYAALKNYDYPAFAESQLHERQQAGMPPFSFQALVRAEARTQAAAQAFLVAASQAARSDMAAWDGWAAILQSVFLYSAVPMGMQRVANVERAQMLVESGSRSALQQFLAAWQSMLHDASRLPACKGLIRWAIDVDPTLV